MSTPRPISPHDPGPTEAFAPLSPLKSYKQVLVQCPQGEWPDNRNKRFLFPDIFLYGKKRCAQIVNQCFYLLGAKQQDSFRGAGVGGSRPGAHGRAARR